MFWLVVFHWRLSDSKSPQVSLDLVSVVDNLNNVVVWMVLILPLITNSTSFSPKPLRTVSSAPTTISIPSISGSIAFSAHWQYPSICLSFSFLIFTLSESKWITNSFFLVNTRPGHLTETEWSVCNSRSQIILCVSFSWTDSVLCIYHLVVRLNFNLLYNSLCITFPTKSSLSRIFLFCQSLTFAYYMIDRVTFVCI